MNVTEKGNREIQSGTSARERIKWKKWFKPKQPSRKNKPTEGTTRPAGRGLKIAYRRKGKKMPPDEQPPGGRIGSRRGRGVEKREQGRMQAQ